MRHPAQLLGLAVLSALIANLPLVPKADATLPTTPPVSSSPHFSPFQPIPLAQDINPSDQKSEAESLFQQGRQQFQDSEFREALRTWEAALILYREIGDQQRE